MSVEKSKQKKHHRAKFKIEKSTHGPILHISFSKSIRNKLKKIRVKGNRLSEETFGIRFYHYMLEHRGTYNFVAFEKNLIDSGKTAIDTIERNALFSIMRDIKRFLRDILDNKNGVGY